MSKNEDISETHDERKNNQLHQQHRHAVRTRKIKNQIPLHHSSRFTKRDRLATQPWKRKQLTKKQDSLDDVFDWDFGTLYHSDEDFQDAAQSTVRDAINTNDASYLNLLLRHRSIQHHRNKYSSDDHYRTKIRNLHTMLTHAIDRGDAECVQVILESIFCGHIYSTIIDHVCSDGRTALWYACKKGDFDLVQQLVEYGHANINKCGILIVAAQNGYEKIVDYLLHRGSDPNRYAKNYNERALHAASRRNHLGIVNALLEYGADPTIFDKKKRTALDYAIHKRHNEIAKVLIYHQGGGFVMNETGFTPLMLAAYCNNTYIVDILLDILPRQQALDELALLACRYIIDGVVHKRDQAYCYFEKALSMAAPLCDSTLYEAYEFRSECQTLDELALIRDNEDAMRIYALLVSERLLPKIGQDQHLISIIIKQSNIYKWQGKLHRCLHLQLHAYPLMIQAKNNKWCTPELHYSSLEALVKVLCRIFRQEGTMPIESLALVWVWILDRGTGKLVKLLINLLCIITYIIGSKKVNNNDQCILLGLIRRAVRQNVVTEDDYFLLGFYINQFRLDRNEHKFSSISVSVLSIIRLLIHCGADVDRTGPKVKSTLLHLSTQCYSVDNARTIIRILLDANAHIDCMDNNGRLPQDLTWDNEIKELLRANQKLSLKCQCARLINTESVRYENYLPSNLIHFIRMHGRNEISTDN